MKEVSIFFQQIWTFWIETWNESKLLFFAEMIGTLCGMFSATMMAWQSPNPDLFIIFSSYNISAICLMYASYVRHSSWMLLLMSFYLFVTTIGWIKVFPCT